MASEASTSISGRPARAHHPPCHRSRHRRRRSVDLLDPDRDRPRDDVRVGDYGHGRCRRSLRVPKHAAATVAWKRERIGVPTGLSHVRRVPCEPVRPVAPAAAPPPVPATRAAAVLPAAPCVVGGGRDAHAPAAGPAPLSSVRRGHRGRLLSSAPFDATPDSAANDDTLSRGPAGCAPGRAAASFSAGHMVRDP